MCPIPAPGVRRDRTVPIEHFDLTIVDAAITRRYLGEHLGGR